MEDRQVKELDLGDCLKSISKLFLAWFINWSLHNPDTSIKSKDIKHTYNI